jgi:hypothetical protein
MFSMAMAYARAVRRSSLFVAVTTWLASMMAVTTSASAELELLAGRGVVGRGVSRLHQRIVQWLQGVCEAEVGLGVLVQRGNVAGDGGDSRWGWLFHGVSCINTAG